MDERETMNLVESSVSAKHLRSRGLRTIDLFVHSGITFLRVVVMIAIRQVRDNHSRRDLLVQCRAKRVASQPVRVEQAASLRQRPVVTRRRQRTRIAIRAVHRLNMKTSRRHVDEKIKV